MTETHTSDRIRLSMLQRRQSLDDIQQHRAAERLAENLNHHPQILASQHIGCYFAIGGELNCQKVIDQLWLAGKQCYLPVIDVESKSMHFHQYYPDAILTHNAYGIAEPIGGQMIDTESLDLVITPLVAFDSNRNRIGMGGGFYDRAFAGAKHPYLLGVAYKFQQVDAIRPESWDVPLHEIVAV